MSLGVTWQSWYILMIGIAQFRLTPRMQITQVQDTVAAPSISPYFYKSDSAFEAIMPFTVH